MADMVSLVLHEEENILGKGENAGYQHFLLFPQCCFSRVIKIAGCLVKAEVLEHKDDSE